MELETLADAFALPNNIKLLVYRREGVAVSDQFVRKFEAAFSDRSAEVAAYKTKNLIETIAFMVWPPVALFIIGYSIVWALRGFKRA